MKQAIYNNDYVFNKKQVYKVLKNKDFQLDYMGIFDKMHCYNFYINDTMFKYYEGLGHDTMTQDNKHDKMLNALWCILQDADTMNFFATIDSFMQEFGYLDYTKALETFRGCKETKDKLSKLFNSQELVLFYDNIRL